MPAQQIDPILARIIRHRGLDPKGDPVLVSSQAAYAPIIAVRKSRPHYGGTGAPDDWPAPLIIPVDEKLPLRGQQFGQPSFLAGHAREVPEKFQMLAANARQHAITWADHFDERRQLAGMIGAHFKHRRLMPG